MRQSHTLPVLQVNMTTNAQENSNTIPARFQIHLAANSYHERGVVPLVGNPLFLGRSNMPFLQDNKKFNRPIITSDYRRDVYAEVVDPQQGLFLLIW